MTDKVQATSQTSETQGQELTPEELEHANGGGGFNIVMADGSVRTVDAADYVVWRKTLGAGG